MSLLEKRSVGLQGEATYRSAFQEFTEFAEENVLPTTTIGEVDQAMLDYLDFLYFEGYQSEKGEKAVAA
eukprot:2169992-Karenia_brevis.AAC.1